MVITLEGVEGADAQNAGRLQNFKSSFASVCSQSPPDFKTCQGHTHPVTGVGLAQSFSICLQQAYDAGADVVFIYEDDAIPFESGFCSKRYQQALLASVPDENLVLLLGGHDFVVDPQNENDNSPFVPMIQSYGTYGYAVKRKDMVPVSHMFADQVAECIAEQRKCSPDVSFYHLARSLGVAIHAVNPLLIDHMKGVYSNTWGKKRSSTKTGEAWMGMRNVYEMINKHPNMNIK